MNKHIYVVCAILFSMACPASLKAAVTEEYNNIEELVADQSAGEQAKVEGSQDALTAPAPVQPMTIRAVPESKSVAIASLGNPDVVLESNVGRPVESWKAISLTPMVGASVFNSAWAVNTRNQYTFGLAIDIPVSRYFSFETEGAYANYRVAYSHVGGPIVGYAFNQYSLGGNAKIYLTTTRFRPYIGAGMAAVFYENMSRMAPNGMRVPYEHIIGAANLLAGVDFRLTDSVSIGARGSYIVPVLNRPVALNAFEPTGLQSARGFEEAGLINSGYFRIMGTVSVSL